MPAEPVDDVREQVEGIPMHGAIDEWILALAEREERAITFAKSIAGCAETIGSAIVEIRLNSWSVRNWLEQLAYTGHTLNDDLSRIESLYIQSEEYRRLVNHIEHHLLEMQRIHKEIRRGTYRSCIHVTQDQDVSFLMTGGSKG